MIVKGCFSFVPEDFRDSSSVQVQRRAREVQSNLDLPVRKLTGQTTFARSTSVAMSHPIAQRHVRLSFTLAGQPLHNRC
jgi:hypothetical protein